MQKEHQFEEVKSTCRALIAHLEKQISVSFGTNEGASPSSSLTNLDVSEATPTLVHGNSTAQKPGEFLRRDEREDVFVGTAHTSRRKSKRRNAPSNKVCII